MGRSPQRYPTTTKVESHEAWRVHLAVSPATSPQAIPMAAHAEQPVHPRQPDCHTLMASVTGPAAPAHPAYEVARPWWRRLWALGAATTVRGATRRPPPRGAPHRPGREAADLAGSAPASGLCRLWPRACGAAGLPGAGADGPLAARRGAPCASARFCCSVARGGGVWHDGRVLARAPNGAGAPPGPLAAPPGPRNQPRGGGACGPPLLGPAQ